MKGGRAVRGKRETDGGGLGNGYASALLNEKLGGGVEINGAWLTSRWCTLGEKFALFVYDWGKMGRERRRLWQGWVERVDEGR